MKILGYLPLSTFFLLITVFLMMMVDPARSKMRRSMMAKNVKLIDLTQTQIGKYFGLDKWANTTLQEEQKQQRQKGKEKKEKKKEKRKDKNKQLKQSEFYTFILILSGIVFVGYYVWMYYINKSHQKQVQELLVKFEQECQVNACTMTDEDIAPQIEYLMTNKWSINFSTKNEKIKDRANITMFQMHRRQKYIYRFKMNMLDSQGGSTGQGSLIFLGDHIGMKFAKTYDWKRKQSKYKGFFNLLIFEAEQPYDNRSFKGKWYFQGFQETAELSGNWEMIYS